MAAPTMNYYGTGRSNYVQVTDVDLFQILCSKYSLDYIGDEKGHGFICSSDDGLPLSDQCNEETGDVETLPYYMEEFRKLLKDGEVLVFIHCGHEGHRVLSFHMCAASNKGKVLHLDPMDFYKKISKLKNKPLGDLLCEY